MRLVLLLALLAWDAPADNPRARFQRLRAEAQAAVQAGDLKAAETKYRALLDLSQEVLPGPYEMYVQVVTPLGRLLRDQGATDKLEQLYVDRVERAAEPLERGLAHADLGFFLQGSDVSADRFHGELMVERAIREFGTCSEKKHCRAALRDTQGVQGAVFFQMGNYRRAETFFREVVAAPEGEAQGEVLLVSLHALRGILILRKDFASARTLEVRAAEVGAKHPEALSRLKKGTERSRQR